MKTQPLDIAKQVWDHNSTNHGLTEGEKANLTQALAHRLIHFFQAGEFYIYLFNVSTVHLEYFSPGIEKVLGYRPDELTIESFFNCIHPEDQKVFVNYEHEWGRFLYSLPKDKLFKYKNRVDLRIRKKDGTYARILHQATIFDLGEDGKILRSLGFHTDISHLKMEGKPTLSFIGLDGEPSYINVQVGEELIPIKELLSKREKQILLLIMDGLPNRAIAAQLGLSKETVDKHRKNMLEKTGCRNSDELIARAIKNGWI